VLHYPRGSTTADAVYGQGGSFTSHDWNHGGISATSLYNPSGVAVDSSGGLYVADTSNNRVLYYPTAGPPPGAAVTIGLSAMPNRALSGQTVTVTATVQSGSGGSGTPSGTVTFKDGSTVLGSGTLTAGTTSISTSSLRLGRHTITAVYTGDGTFGGSDATVVVTVSLPSTALTLQASPLAIQPGQTLTLTATVQPAGGGSGTPTGTVTVKDGSTVLGTGTLNGSGATSISTNALATAGTHTLVATYSGDSNFAGTARSLLVTVSPTSITLQAAPAVIQPGQTLALTATVLPGSGGSGIPTGTVTFKDGTTVLGSGMLNGSGVASISTNALATAGVHTIVATYSGDSNFAGTARALLVTVSPTTITLQASPLVIQPGQTLSLTATVLPGIGGSGTPSGMVIFKDGATVLGSGTLNGSGATSISTNALVTVGTHTVVATYSGDSNFAGTARALLVLVKPAT
jgi:large repetitive protein